MNMGIKSKQYAKVTILTSDKIKFKPKTAIKGKGGHYIIKKPIH